jgi:biotin transport system substrate-specific component
MRNETVLDVFRPEAKNSAFLYDLTLVLGATIFITLSAQVAIPVPFSPVPITGQTFAVLLTGALLGSRRGTLAVLLYLLEGSLGLPVFAGAKAGIIHLFGPTGGYLAGFVPAVFLVGYLAERGWDCKIGRALFIFSAGTMLIFLCGLAWLLQFTSWAQLAAMGIWPYLPGAFLKIISAALLAPVLRRFVS